MTNKIKVYKIEYIDEKGKLQVKGLFANSPEQAIKKLKLENKVSEIKSHPKEQVSLDGWKN